MLHACSFVQDWATLREFEPVFKEGGQQCGNVVEKLISICLILFVLHMLGVGSDTPVWEALPSDVFAPCWVKRHNISCSIRSWFDHGIINSTSTCGLAIAPPCRNSSNNWFQTRVTTFAKHNHCKLILLHLGVVMFVAGFR